MSRFVIQGGRKISGTHRVSGNKNAALPMIAASLLTSETVTLRNVPDIADVAAMLDAAKSFGAKVTRLAFGLPADSGIAYSDALTLRRAIVNRITQ